MNNIVQIVIVGMLCISFLSLFKLTGQQKRKEKQDSNMYYESNVKNK